VNAILVNVFVLIVLTLVVIAAVLVMFGIICVVIEEAKEKRKRTDEPDND